jgi:shikimate kinase
MTLGRDAIVLIGMRGAGKTSVGRALARQLGVPFFDLDDRIERRTRRTVRALFEAEGEAAFRAREVEELRSIAAGRCVLATGGGVVETAAARRELGRAGTRIWLQVGVDELARRLARDRTRPRLRAGSWLSELRALARRRGPAYRRLATRVVRCGERRAEDVARSLAQLRS